MVMAIKNHLYVRDFPLQQTLLFSFGTQSFLILLSNVVSLAYAFSLVFKANKANNLKAKNVKLIYSIISIFLISTFPTLLFLVYVNMLVTGIFSFGFVFPTNMFTNYQYLFTLVTPVSFLFFPKLIYGLNQQASIIYRLKEVFAKKEEAIAVVTEASTEKDKIISYITNEKPYLSPTFSMHTLSKDLNIPHLRVSSCFNKEMNISFPEYRKRKRVDHAIALFKEGAHQKMSIEGISAQSGFKNKSSFFLAFQTEFKMTPTEWIAKNL
jgi:AraC-like DNA-binding protein